MKSSRMVRSLRDVLDVPRVVFSLYTTSRTPSVAQGVSAREHGMAGLGPVYDRWYGTSIDNSAWPVSVNADRVNVAWKYISISSLSVLPTDIPVDVYDDNDDPPVIVAPANVHMSHFSLIPMIMFIFWSETAELNPWSLRSCKYRAQMFPNRLDANGKRTSCSNS